MIARGSLIVAVIVALAAGLLAQAQSDALPSDPVTRLGQQLELVGPRALSGALTNT